MSWISVKYERPPINKVVLAKDGMNGDIYTGVFIGDEFLGHHVNVNATCRLNGDRMLWKLIPEVKRVKPKIEPEDWED